MAKNNYVNWVSDSHFRKCVKHVCDAYVGLSDPESKKFHKNTIDPFSVIFDMLNSGLSFDEWVKAEQVRQAGKTVSNRIGEFHQMLLGGVDDWRDLGVGDDSKVDLVNQKKGIYVEIKNKYNTTNSDSLGAVRRKLERILEKNPSATCYWAYILTKTGLSEDRIWHKKRFKSKNSMRRISGKKVYELITGVEDSLEQMWFSLPIVISDVLNSENSLDNETKKKLQSFFERAFRA